jgi:exopolysaccharide production protein ExoQ
VPPLIALIACIAGIAGLFYFDRDRKAQVSGALWIPVAWMLIAGSRPVSQWLSAFGWGGGQATDVADLMQDGSPVDRNVWILLLVLGLVVLFNRRLKIANILMGNLPLVVFFGYCALSILWSDYPEVAFKRWIKDLGDLVMLLVVLSERDLLGAVKKYFSRASFLLIPLSVLFIKYFPALGRGYNRWTWVPLYGGVTTNKNTLGMICMLFGLAAEWRFIAAWKDQSNPRRRYYLMAHGAILLLALWLFMIANSMTSFSCFLLGSGVMVAMSFRAVLRRPVLMHLVVAAAVVMSFSALFLNVAGGELIESMGRDATLTGRTEIWKDVLSVSGSPIFGTGFESFWLGPRLQKMWSLDHDPNVFQAHNGYLEIYLNLGWLGVLALFGILVAGYRRIMEAVRKQQDASILWLGFFVVGIVYNFTEASFKMLTPMWICFLLAFMAAERFGRLQNIRRQKQLRMTAKPFCVDVTPASTFPQSAI